MALPPYGNMAEIVETRGRGDTGMRRHNPSIGKHGLKGRGSLLSPARGGVPPWMWEGGLPYLRAIPSGLSLLQIANFVPFRGNR
jgi:hypothetical protein